MTDSSSSLKRSSSESRPTQQEWNSWKSKIEQLYLRDEWTLPRVQQHLSREGFDATQRQFKLRLKAWRFGKKINGELWKAMAVVLRQIRVLKGSILFSVPLKNGDSRTITAGMIAKQMRRSKGDLLDYEDAARMLHRSRVRIHPRKDLAPSIHPSECARRVVAFHHRGVLPEPRLQSSWRRGHLVIENWRWSPSIMISPELAHYHGRKHGVTLPSIQALIDASVFPPHAPDLRPIWHQSSYHLRVQNHIGSVESFDTCSDVVQWSSDPAYNRSTRWFIRNYIGIDTTSNMTCISSDKRLAMEWITYYVLRSVPKEHRIEPAPREWTQARATNAFGTMLEQRSEFILLFCISMSAVFGSNSEHELLEEFFRDCCHVIETSSSSNPHLELPFHFALALCSQDRDRVATQGQRLEGLLQSRLTCWARNSPSDLVFRHYYAWQILEIKQYAQAFVMLHQCLTDSIEIMGPTHILTVSCLAILSRAYDEVGNTQRAIDLIEGALTGLQDDLICLLAFKHRLFLRLAKMLEKTGRYSKAEDVMYRVLSFRLGWFGIRRPETWNAIDSLQALLTRTGKRPCADELLSEMMRAWRDAELATHVAKYGSRPAWECQTCGCYECKGHKDNETQLGIAVLNGT